MSLQLHALNILLRLTVKRRFRKNPDIMELRAIMQGQPIPRTRPRITVEQVNLGGVTAECLQGQNASSQHALLYIHGGGFVAGVPANYRALTWRLTERTGVPVYAIDYRLAPENPFPAGLDDCVSAYRGLLDKGMAADAIAIGGDSAGGNLTLACALKLKALGLPQPAALVCLSPVVDLAVPGPSHKTNAKSDVLFDPRTSDTVAKSYCPGHDLGDPLISPLRGDVRGLPPTLFLASRAELLRDDAVRMSDKMRAAGVPVTLQIWPRVFHAWPMMADILPEGHAAIVKIAAFVNEHLMIGASA
jgi:monoterpene epsilon-lactone hydrolase